MELLTCPLSNMQFSCNLHTMVGIGMDSRCDTVLREKTVLPNAFHGTRFCIEDVFRGMGFKEVLI